MTDTYTFQSPIGSLKISEENGAIIGLSLQKETADILLPQTNIRHSDLLYEAYRQLNEYFAGKRIRFDLPLYCVGTAFQKQVWNALQSIPYGETKSYEDIAEIIGNPKAVRAVGQANGKNPIMIIIPCHRVIRKNGDISGFAYGTNIKKYLLALEENRAHTSEEPVSWK